MPRAFEVRSTYTVQPGDTLGAIAAAHDISLDLLELANAGIISNPNLIQVGWELVIPGGAIQPSTDLPPGMPELEEHTVAAGDTLGAIATGWGCSVDEVATLNGIADRNRIAIGQRIRRPGAGVAPVEPAAAAPVVAATATPEPVAAPAATPGRLVFDRWPVAMPPGVVTGGYREDYGGYLHRGIDIGGASVGTPIVAPAPGIAIVHRPGDGWGSGGFGINVVLDHPGTPWYSIYAHMSETDITTGQSVRAGDRIGRVGFTGRVVPQGPGGAHLHWQVSSHSGFPIDFAYIANPRDFLV